MSAPGKDHRQGISLIELAQKFPNEDAARAWFESILWPDGVRRCPTCGGDNTHECSHKTMPYRCRDCRKYFSVKTGTLMAGSPLPLLKWVYAIYLDTTSLKGVSSMKLHRDLHITQKTAWHMLQRIREAFAAQGPQVQFAGPVEVDETYIGGKRKNMPKSVRKQLTGRGPVGKTAIVGASDRSTGQVAAKVVTSTDRETLQGFVRAHVAENAEVFTDEATAYRGLPNHESVRHSVGEYVDRHIHTNTVESFWSMLKRAHKGTFHKLSPKHLQRYVNEFAGRQNLRNLDTIDQMERIASQLAGKSLDYATLIAPNGLASGARKVA